MKINQGQCGICRHFGEPHSKKDELVKIRATQEGSEQVLDLCGHPLLARVHLRVSTISGCDKFESAIADSTQSKASPSLGL